MGGGKVNFSVLMSVYKNDKADFLKKALDSVIYQTLKPSEIVLVQDGPLTKDLFNIIDNYVKKCPNLIKIINLENNLGLGKALKIGLEKCSNNIVARMDADDISKKDRFEKQIKYLEENKDIDVVGSWISEFDGEESNIYAYRKLPTNFDQIKEFAKKRNPLNHVTVMFRKNKVINVGSYKGIIGFEDYYLWVRMLLNGSKFYNIPEYLVNVRAGKEMIKRRGGLNYIKNELKLQKKFLKIGFINKKEFVFNILTRSIIRLLPANIRNFVYQKALRK